jgi:hypothetical protein
MFRVHAGAVDYAILAVYFVVVLGIGFAARRQVHSGLDFFLSGRSLPAWITGLAFIAANLGALEILGLAANGAKYGVATVHFYWIGAVPAMVFLGIVMMPFYYNAKVRSVPEYLRLRYNDPTHVLNSLSFAVATVLIAGVNLFAMALVIRLLLGWPIPISIVLAAAIVLVYITLGGLSSAIYNEVLQFFVILAGLVPLTIVGLKAVGGWSGLQDKVTAAKALGPLALQPWEGTGPGNVTNPIGADWVAIVFGLGFVLSFGYWTTNFAEVQRALAAKNLSAARRTPPDRGLPQTAHPVPGRGSRADRRRHHQGPGGQDRRPAVQQLGPDPDLDLPAQRDARDRHHRAAGRLHGRGGRERDRLQHRGQLRPLAGLCPQGRARRVLHPLWPHRHRPRDRGGDRHGLHRRRVQQHHGLHPGAVLVLQCAPVRHLPTCHVLEARHPMGGLLGAGLGHLRRRRRPLPPLPRPAGPRLPPGRRLLGGGRGLRGRRGGDGRGQPGHPAQARPRAPRAGLA